MKLDIDKLTEYDLSNAKVGDKIVVGHGYDYRIWRFNQETIKSISPKRGDITLSGGGKYKKDGRKMGVGIWDRQYDYFFEYTQENIVTINRHTRALEEAGCIVKLFREIEKQGFKMLYDLSEEEISALHKTLQEIFGAEND